MKAYDIVSSKDGVTVAQCRECKWYVATDAPEDMLPRYFRFATCLCEPHDHTIYQRFDSGHTIVSMRRDVKPHELILEPAVKEGDRLTIGKPGVPFKSFVVARVDPETGRCVLRETTKLHGVAREG